MIKMELSRRPNVGFLRVLIALLAALLLTLVIGAIIFASLGLEPINALKVYFIDPVSNLYGFQELTVKASPLIMIAVGLSFCYRANVWNIGAEGQFIAGAIVAGGLALSFADSQSQWALLIVLAGGITGGILASSIVAFARVQLNTNEILTSLMLTYVFTLLLDYVVRSPWRDPQGFGFPQTAMFSPSVTFPLLEIEALGYGRMHWGIVFAIIIAFAAWFYLSKMRGGFGIDVIGRAPRAARFAGYSQDKTIWSVLLASGGLAGLAGAIEVTGPIGQLTPTISPGYGFTAIIVAFLGRLHPIGIIFAGFVIALSFIGGEFAQTMLKVPKVVTNVFQGILLFMLLLADTLTKYKIHFRRVGSTASTKPSQLVAGE